MGGSDVVRCVAENEHMLWVEGRAEDLTGALDRLACQLAAVGRIGAVRAEREEAVQIGTRELDVRGGLDGSGRNPKQEASLAEPRKQLLDPVEDLVTGRTRNLLREPHQIVRDH